jgi:hypothetical protein
VLVDGGDAGLESALCLPPGWRIIFDRWGTIVFGLLNGSADSAQTDSEVIIGFTANTADAGMVGSGLGCDV